MFSNNTSLFTPLSLAAGDIGGESVRVMPDLDEVVETELGDLFREVDLAVGGANISWENSRNINYDYKGRIYMG